MSNYSKALASVLCCVTARTPSPNIVYFKLRYTHATTSQRYMTESLLVCSSVLHHALPALILCALNKDINSCISSHRLHVCYTDDKKFAVLLHSGRCITQSQPHNCLLYDPAHAASPRLLSISNIPRWYNFPLSLNLSKVLSSNHLLPLLYAVIPPDVGVATRYGGSLFNSRFPPENCHPVQRGRLYPAMEPAKRWDWFRDRGMIRPAEVNGPLCLLLAPVLTNHFPQSPQRSHHTGGRGLIISSRHC